MKTVLKKHPLAIRWFHWINFPILGIMIWSGLLIYWAYSKYTLSVGNRQLFHFFSPGFYKALKVPHRLAEGMSFHFAFMWLFFGNGLLYVTYTIFSGEWRYLLPNRKSFKEGWQVLLHDLHIHKYVPPQDKYNAAQRIAYTAIIVMGFGSIITGLAIYKPVEFGWCTWLCGGYESARLIHFMLTIGYCLFFVVHIVQVIITGWNNFQSIVTGIEIFKPITPEPQPQMQIETQPEEVQPSPIEPLPNEEA